MVEAGLSPLDALHATTGSAAELLDVASDRGTIRPGLSAPTWCWSTGTPTTSPSSASGCARSTSTASRSAGVGADLRLRVHDRSPIQRGALRSGVDRSSPVQPGVEPVPRRRPARRGARGESRGERKERTRRAILDAALDLLRGQQPGRPLPAPGGQGGRHRPDRVLPALRLDRGPRAGPGRGVVRLAAGDAARRTTQRPDLPQHHRQLGEGARRAHPPPSTPTSPSSPASGWPARRRSARRSGTRSSSSSASSPPTSPG